ncbi:MAG: hypothetical protein EA361_02320 [Bacteroidetes bacterium]|nr:MAG: hypothetical protein EA361_02320 [Bacteroidota bacterium]
MKNHSFLALLTSALAFFLLSGCLKDEDKGPKVKTSAATRITGTTVVLNGAVIYDNKVQITYETGFYWGLEPEPGRMEHTISEPFVQLRGDFEYLLTNLEPNTTYYFRAFGENENGKGYGKVESFTTHPEENTIVNITQAIPYAAHAIYASMEVTFNFPQDYIKEWGYCIAEERLPTLDDEVVIKNKYQGNHLFYDLKGNTNYHLRAYAILKDGRVFYSLPEIVKTREIQMDPISNITFRSAVTDFSIDFSDNIEYIGLRWHTNPNPAWGEGTWVTGRGPYLMANLEPGTTYYVKPFVRSNLYWPHISKRTIYGPYKKFITPPLPDIGQGTLHDPYTTNGAIYLKTSDETVWVKGYIVGVPKSGYLYSNSAINNTEPFTENNYILLAEDPDEVFMGNTLRVTLPAGNIQYYLNLVQNPENLGKEIMIEGDLYRYTSGSPFTGLRNVTEYMFVDKNQQK